MEGGADIQTFFFKVTQNVMLHLLTNVIIIFGHALAYRVFKTVAFTVPKVFSHCQTFLSNNA